MRLSGWPITFTKWPQGNNPTSCLHAHDWHQADERRDFAQFISRLRLSGGSRIHCRLEAVEAVELGVMVRLVDRNDDDEGSSLRVRLSGGF
jgi:hypothetical protein